MAPLRNLMGPLRRLVLRLSEAFRASYSIIFGRPSNFSEFIDGIYASGIPCGGRSARWLRRVGITAVVSLTEKPPRLNGLELVHIPMRNGEPAELSQLSLAVSAIDSLLSRGHRVLVHCSAGKDRTGMVLAAYLIAKRGLSAEEAISFVRLKRKGSIGGRAQVESVVRFWEATKRG